MRIINYGGYHFIPAGRFTETDFDRLSRLIRGTGIHAGWSREDFLKAADDDYDVYICLENGKKYTPGDNELFEYMGEVTDAPEDTCPDTEFYVSGAGKFSKCGRASFIMEIYERLPRYADKEMGFMTEGVESKTPVLVCRNGFESISVPETVTAEVLQEFDLVWDHLRKAKFSAMYYMPDLELYLAIDEKNDGVHYTLTSESRRLLGAGIYHGACKDSIVEDIAEKEFGFIPGDYVIINPDEINALAHRGSGSEIRVVMKDGVVKEVYSTKDMKDVLVRVMNTKTDKPKHYHGLSKHANLIKEASA